MNPALNQLILGSPIFTVLVDFFIQVYCLCAIFFPIYVSISSFIIPLELLNLRFSTFFYALALAISFATLHFGLGSPYVPTNLVIVFNFACLQMCSNFKSTASTGSRSSASSRKSQISSTRSTSGVRTRSMKLIQSPSTVRTGIHELEEEDTRLPPKKNVQGRLHFSSPDGTGSPGEITTKTGDQLLGLRQADSLAPAGELETPRTTNAIINDSLSVALEVEPRPTSQLSNTTTNNAPPKRYFPIFHQAITKLRQQASDPDQLNPVRRFRTPTKTAPLTSGLTSMTSTIQTIGSLDQPIIITDSPENTQPTTLDFANITPPPDSLIAHPPSIISVLDDNLRPVTPTTVSTPSGSSNTSSSFWTGPPATLQALNPTIGLTTIVPLPSSTNVALPVRPSSPSSTSSSDSESHSSDRSASSWEKPGSSSWTGPPLSELKAITRTCHIISFEDRRRRLTATELNVPYNPQSSLLQLLNSSRRIRNLVAHFYCGTSSHLSGKKCGLKISFTCSARPSI